MDVDPRTEYARRRDAHRALMGGLARRREQFATARLVVAATTVVLIWLMVGPKVLMPYWLFVPLAVFALLVIQHDRVTHQRTRAERAVAFYERGLARLSDAWAGQGEGGSRYLDSAHLYAEDLDLFGKGSLFELMCTARTSLGEATLARWLTVPASIEEAQARQVAVEELRPRLDLREELALLGADVRMETDPDALVAWGRAPAISFPPMLHVGAPLLGMGNLVVLGGWIFFGWGPFPFLITLSISAGVMQWTRGGVRSVIGAVEKRGRDVALLCELLERLEQEPVASSKLVELARRLRTEEAAASVELRRLRRLIHLLDSSRNELFMAIGFLVLWNLQVAVAIEGWRQRWGGTIALWLSALGEVEALCSIAGYAYEHPMDPFAEWVREGVEFSGEGLGHPLIPESKCVRNDVRLGGELRVLVVSGSNMSGKSTLLRTVGTNGVLALAGAPVRARRLRLSPLALGASIRRMDSLQDGTSRFYAEIKRIRQLVDVASGPRPLLYLVDEILHGTNSHDRQIGSEAIVRSFLSRGAMGLVTTHDLALAKVADELAPRAANVHFEDHLEGGRMVFDYRLRPGVVTKSNALELMRSMGLEV